MKSHWCALDRSLFMLCCMLCFCCPFFFRSSNIFIPVPQKFPTFKHFNVFLIMFTTEWFLKLFDKSIRIELVCRFLITYTKKSQRSNFIARIYICIWRLNICSLYARAGQNENPSRLLEFEVWTMDFQKLQMITNNVTFEMAQHFKSFDVFTVVIKRKTPNLSLSLSV